MKRRDFLTATAGLGIAAAATPLRAADVIEWKMVTSWPKNFPGVGTSAEIWARNIDAMSGGRLKIKVYGAGELVPAFEVFDAVSQGVAEVGHTASAYWKGKLPEAQLFCAAPFGMTAFEQMSWIYYGGGLELWEEVYAPHGLIPFPVGSSLTQAGGWFRKEINSLADLKGLRMRIPGMGGDVLKRAGGTPLLLPGSELLVAMQTGVIDAAEWAGPWNDFAFGLHRTAKNYYFPGWQEPNAVLEGIVNRAAFEALPADLQEIVRASAQAVTLDLTTMYLTHNRTALTTLREKHGVMLRRFPDDMLATLRTYAQEVIADEASRNAMSQRVTDSYLAFQNGAQWVTHMTDAAFWETRDLAL